ncbi:MAG TPA: hypothetical protein DCY12_10815 [Candidatus Atribacteria bacterium]|nr:hypothetical protein [Candidatus Atribacteria bacterium]
MNKLLFMIKSIPNFIKFSEFVQMMKKGGRYGKYGEQKRRERFQQKRLTEYKFQSKPSPMEKWRGKKEK